MSVEKTLAFVIVDSSLVLWGWVRGLKRKRGGRTVKRDLGSNPLRLSFLFKSVVCGYYLVTLSLTVNETLKWFSSLGVCVFWFVFLFCF